MHVYHIYVVLQAYLAPRLHGALAQLSSQHCQLSRQLHINSSVNWPVATNCAFHAGTDPFDNNGQDDNGQAAITDWQHPIIKGQQQQHRPGATASLMGTNSTGWTSGLLVAILVTGTSTTGGDATSRAPEKPIKGFWLCVGILRMLWCPGMLCMLWFSCCAVSDVNELCVTELMCASDRVDAHALPSCTWHDVKLLCSAQCM